MCRMLLANREGLLRLHSALSNIPGCGSLEAYLEALELRDGGDGNGYALLKDGNLSELRKGVFLPCAEAARAMLEKEYDWVLFHSREASEGSVNDANCHPFSISLPGSPPLIAAINGNEASLSGLAKVAGNMTDSEFILQAIVRMKLPLFPTLQLFESNFFGFYGGYPFVKKGNRDMLIWRKGDGIVFASDFPFGMKGLEKPPQNYCWCNGKDCFRLFCSSLSEKASIAKGCSK